jgi:diguanylate cyclase (GGDEF)-like protein/PAS domain S-box-containing protein
MKYLYFTIYGLLFLAAIQFIGNITHVLRVEDHGVIDGILLLVIAVFAIILNQYSKSNKKMLKRLIEGEKRYKSLFAHNPDPVLSFDKLGNITSANPEAVKCSGYLEDELLAKNFSDMLVPGEQEKVSYYFQNVLHGTAQNYETAFHHKNGDVIELHVKNMPIYKNNEIVGVFSILKDVTENNKAQQLLDGQTRVLEMIAKGFSITEIFGEINHIFEYQSKGGLCSILVVDESKTKLMTGSATSLPDEYNQSINGSLISETSGSCGTALHLKKRVFVSDIATDPLWVNYRHLALKHGLKSCWSSPILDNTDEILGAFAVYYKYGCLPSEKDIQLIDKATYLAKLAILHFKAEEKINHMAFHDALTGLANRRLFKNKFEDALIRARDSGAEIGLLFLDLDRFKIINDSLGHSLGDLLLQKVADRLKFTLERENIICRQGGDEFLILLEGVSLDETLQAANRIIQSLAQPFRLMEHEVVITPSIGISRYPEHGDDPDSLIKNADIAMYDAKRQGKNNYQLYRVTPEEVTSGQLVLEQNLRKALENKEFVLHYQPQLDLKTGSMSGVEALIRWQHPTLGFISPSRFIPLAEETGLIVPIGEWVLRTACFQNKAWQQAGLEPVVVSVNLSIRQFFKPDLISTIKKILEETGLEPQYLELEITESMTMNIESAIQIIHELKHLGVKVAIDDFGTGYSSLNYLKKLPIDRLKIDQSFVRDIEKISNDRDIVATIITMGHNLKMRVIAEGVESEEQLQFLNIHGCDEVQGYLISKPMPSEEFTREYWVDFNIEKRSSVKIS